MLAQDSFSVEFIHKRLYTKYEEWGLKVSLQKTEYQVVNSETSYEIFINDDAQINQVQTFKYLECMIDKNEVGNTEIKHHIQKVER